MFIHVLSNSAITISRNIVEDLEDYSLYANNLSQQERQKVAGLVIQALESSATIEDNRSLYY